LILIIAASLCKDVECQPENDVAFSPRFIFGVSRAGRYFPGAVSGDPLNAGHYRALLNIAEHRKNKFDNAALS
jgi:hypothetical protein